MTVTYITINRGEHVGRDGEAFESWDSDRPMEPSAMPLPKNQ